MIIVHLIGGLGNQMFQYALGRYIAEINSTLLKLDLSGFEDYKLHRYALHCFKIWQHVATIEEIKALKREPVQRGRIARIANKLGIYGPSESSHYYRDAKKVVEKSFPFDPAVLQERGHLYLQGYWQSEKYFSSIRDVLLREFEFVYEPNAKNKGLAEQIKQTKSVSLHVRRGDYVSVATTNQFHGVSPLEYYRKAVDRIIQRVPESHFYLFSDDPAWVKENLKLDHPVTVVDHNDASRNFEDLRLMSLCRHHIIANSSFSWWGAWLNKNPEKMVFAPRQWFQDPQVDARDIIPESWIQV